MIGVPKQKDIMHKLKPNTSYRIVAILVAVPDTIDNATLADGLNEMMRPALDCDDAVFDDYALKAVQLPEVKSSDDPEEGEVFPLKNYIWLKNLDD